MRFPHLFRGHSHKVEGAEEAEFKIDGDPLPSPRIRNVGLLSVNRRKALPTLPSKRRYLVCFVMVIVLLIVGVSVGTTMGIKHSRPREIETPTQIPSVPQQTTSNVVTPLVPLSGSAPATSTPTPTPTPGSAASSSLSTLTSSSVPNVLTLSAAAASTSTPAPSTDDSRSPDITLTTDILTFVDSTLTPAQITNPTSPTLTTFLVDLSPIPGTSTVSRTALPPHTTAFPTITPPSLSLPFMRCLAC
ncbi:hypothetical protein BD779DRAFT_428033 [Infundibulicybe gibba]|nr:hypothetical protein BD779DRAFT_428033 [Infundibulicybe gibba]